MVEVVIKGIGLGLLIAVLVGPVFFLLIQTSIHKGFLQALYLALGISASDATYIVLVYSGFAQFTSDPTITRYMGLAGGALLVVFGTVILFKKAPENKEIDIKLPNKDRLKYFIKGYTLNFINPSVCLFWIGSVSVVSAQYEQNDNFIYAFFIATVATVFFTDMLKIYLSKKLSKILNPVVLKTVSSVSGLLMIGYGVKLIIEKWSIS